VVATVQMLDVNACRSTHLIGDSADVAASTICKDYESRDDEAKRATFQTSTPEALARFDRRFAATLAHALYLDAAAPPGLFNRDKKGLSFAHRMGSDDLQAGRGGRPARRTPSAGVMTLSYESQRDRTRLSASEQRGAPGGRGARVIICAKR
jgi:hypothetical protein